MNKLTSRWLAIAGVMALTFAMIACADAPPANDADSGAALEEAGEHGGSEGEARGEGGEGEHGGAESRGEEGEGEHGEGGDHSEGEEGEESGVYISSSDTWDNVRRGARLVLKYNADSGAFEGTVENTTSATLCAVRVEVHLGDGPELGPTDRTDVAAGGSITVTLSAEGESFESWTAHPELSRCGG